MDIDLSPPVIHIPEGIRFQCSGCGNCCLQWPVPLTRQDVDRIQSLLPEDPAERHVTSEIDGEMRVLRALLKKPGGPGFRALNPGDRRFRGFSHTLEKRADGRCRFLLQDNRCQLHLEYGADSKPAMCRLFPYAFCETPSGVFAYVSFASSAVLFNQGRPLAEQPEILAEKYRLYRHLFPRVSQDWTGLQILDGHRLQWGSFLALEERLLAIIVDDRYPCALDKLAQCSRFLLAELPPSADPDKLPELQARPETVDWILLKHLHSAYLPADVFAEDSFDLDSRALVGAISDAPGTVSFGGGGGGGGGGVSMEKLRSLQLGLLGADSEDLLRRFIYCRLFAKLYLGPGLAHLSMLAGIHHLFLIVAVVHLHLKLLKLSGKSVDFLSVAEAVRTVERRLCQMNFSPESSAVMEVLMSSPARLPRVRELCR